MRLLPAPSAGSFSFAAMEEFIDFFEEDVEFSLDQAEAIKAWMVGIIQGRGYDLHGINIIFCSDEYLRRLNHQFLDHDYYTDILTFPYQEPGQPLLSDIYISLDRVADNARQVGVSLRDELHRVMIHGLLHLTGMDDKDEAAMIAMRQAEDDALAARQF